MARGRDPRLSCDRDRGHVAACRPKIHSGRARVERRSTCAAANLDDSPAVLLGEQLPIRSVDGQLSGDKRSRRGCCPCCAAALVPDRVDQLSSLACRLLERAAVNRVAGADRVRDAVTS